MKEIYFANPTGIYFLVLMLAIIALLLYSLTQRRQVLKNFAADESLPSLLFLEKRTWMRYVLLSGVWLLATLALMQPERHKDSLAPLAEHKEVIDETLIDNQDHEKVVIKRRACDVIFMLDTSASMTVEDTRPKNSRLDFAKEIIDEMVRGLDGQNVALYSFTSALTPIVPSTLDYFFTRLMLKDVNVNYGDIAGTDLFEALDQVSKKHFFSSSEKQKVLVILTDGGDTYLDTLSNSEREHQIQLMLSRLGPLEEKNVRIFTIGLGSPEKSHIPKMQFDGAPILSGLDSDLLKKISVDGRGQYYLANDYSSVALASAILDVVRAENTYIEHEIEPSKKLKRSILEKNESSHHVQKLYAIPLGLALLLLALEIVLPLWPLSNKVNL